MKFRAALALAAALAAPGPAQAPRVDYNRRRTVLGVGLSLVDW